MIHLEYLIVGTISIIVVTVTIICIFNGAILMTELILEKRSSNFTIFEKIRMAFASIILIGIFLAISYTIGSEIIG